MNDVEVKALLTQVSRGKAAAELESPVLDFKTEGRSTKDFVNDLAGDAVCFANASGGTIIIGVRNSPGGSDAIVGCDVLDAAKLRSSIHDLTNPPLLVSVQELAWEAERVLIVEVPEGLEVHSTSQGGYRQRWETQCLPMAPSDVSRLADERRGSDWSSASTAFSIADVDARALDIARSLLGASQNTERRLLALRSASEILGRLGLMASERYLTRAAAILFIGPSDDASQESVIYQHRRTMSGEADFSRRWAGPLLSTFSEVFDAIRTRLNVTPVNLSTGQQIAMEDYPEVAVREALANALIHRDYRENEPVAIIHSPERLSVTSPGPLVSGITASNILIRGSKPRYPLLARAANELGLVEYLGLGVNRMFREMARSGRSLPGLVADRDSVRINLEGGPPNVRVARLIASLPDDLIEDTDTLLTIVALRQKRTVTAKSLTTLLQKAPDEVEVALRRMSSAPAALIEPSPATRSRRHPSYHLTGKTLSALGSSLAYHTRTRDEVDRKVIEHVRDFDVINNAAVQRMLDVDVYASRDILRDLVVREVLVRTSPQTRGKAVRYGRGPKFPREARPRARSDIETPPGDGELW